MKKIFFLFVLFAFLCGYSRAQTTVFFPGATMVGSTNDFIVNIQSLNNPVIWNGHFYYLPFNGTNVPSTNGVATTTLIPGNYVASFVGLPQSWTFGVTNSATPLNVALLPSHLTFYSGVQTLVAGGNTTIIQNPPGTFTISSTGGSGTGTITNGLSTNATGVIVIGPNIIVSTNYDALGAALTAQAAAVAEILAFGTETNFDQRPWTNASSGGVTAQIFNGPLNGNAATATFATTAGNTPNALTNNNLGAVLLLNSVKVNGQFVVTNGGNTPLQVTNSDGSSLAINHVNKSGNNLYTVTDTNSDQTTYDAKDGLLDLQGDNGIDFLSAGGSGIQIDGGQNNFTNVNLLSANTFTGSGSGLTGVPPAAVSTVGATPGYVMTDVGGVSTYAALPPGNSTNLSGYNPNFGYGSSTMPLGVTGAGPTNVSIITNSVVYNPATTNISSSGTFPLPIVFGFNGFNVISYFNIGWSNIQATINATPNVALAVTNLVTTNIYYVRLNGNDSSAVAGDLSRPWLTFTSALASVVSPYVIDLGVGTFWTANTTNGSVLPPNGSVRGQGVNMTALNQANLSLASTNNTSTNCPGLVIGGDNIELHDFTLGTNTGQGQFYFPLELSHGTNLYVHNVTIDGDSDCIYANSLAFANVFSNSISGGQQPVFLNDNFNSGYDTVVLLASPGTGATNSSIGFHNCTFKVIADPNFQDAGNFPSRGIFLEHVTAAVRNCTFSISNVYEAYGIYIAATSGVTNWLTLQNNGITVIGGGSALNSVYVNGANAYTKLDGPFNADQASFGTSAVQLGDAVFGTIGGDGTALTNRNGALSTLLPASLVNSNQAAQIAALSGGSSSGSYNTNVPPLEFGFGNWLLTTNGAHFIITNSFNGNLPLELDQYGNVIAGNGFDVGSSAMTASSISSAGYLLLGVYGSFTGINDAIWFTEGSTVATYKLGIQAEDSTDLGFITTNANFAYTVNATGNVQTVNGKFIGNAAGVTNLPPIILDTFSYGANSLTFSASTLYYVPLNGSVTPNSSSVNASSGTYGTGHGRIVGSLNLSTQLAPTTNFTGWVFTNSGPNTSYAACAPPVTLVSGPWSINVVTNFVINFDQNTSNSDTIFGVSNAGGGSVTFNSFSLHGAMTAPLMQHQ